MDSLTLSRNKLLPAAQNFDLLRLAGIGFIEKLSGDQWTDFNHSDPGITLLEAICYALTDLSYRISLPFQDLISTSDTKAGYQKDLFYEARQILPCNALTANDLRKIIIDMDGVLNAWVEKCQESEVLIFIHPSFQSLTYDPESNQYLALKGLHKIHIEYEDSILIRHEQNKVHEKIKEKILGHRNLCEDFVEIVPVQYEDFSMEAEIYVHEGSDINTVQAQIFLAVKNFFSPPVPFYRYEEMVQKGYTLDEILEGPILRHGFLDDADLDNSAEFKNLHLSDLIKVLLEIEPIIGITNLVIPEIKKSEPYPNNDFSSWLTTLGLDKKIPKLNIEKTKITYFRSGDRFRSPEEKVANGREVESILNFLLGNQAHSRLKGYHPQIKVPEGTYMETGNYYPFQLSLPVCYGTQSPLWDKIPKDEKEKRTLLEQIKPENIPAYQLKGYLMVFEQILANHFAQLGNIRELFSNNPNQKSTYFSQLPDQVLDYQYLYSIDYKHFKENILPKITEKQETYLARQLTFLDHLLGLYNEDFSGYDKVMNTIKDLHPVAVRLIEDKINFLQDYIEVSNYRFKGFNFKNQDENTAPINVSGFERRLYRLLGMAFPGPKHISVSYIKIQTHELENGIKRFSVQVVDPENHELILLKSNEFEFENEAENTLNYILKFGWNPNNYDKEYKRKEVSFKLKRITEEGDFEYIAHKQIHVHDKNEIESIEILELEFNRLMEVMNQITQKEGFYLLEHILLRPKIGHRALTQKSKIDADGVHLLNTGNTSEVVPTHELSEFHFQIERIIKTKNDSFWKLKLMHQSGEEILVIEEDFEFYRHLNRRISLIKDFAVDVQNYFLIKKEDGSQFYELRSTAHRLGKTQVVTDLEIGKKLIQSIIRFFSLESFKIPDSLNEWEQDPYSFRMSMVVPKWPKRFQDSGFCHLFEKLVYLETPAHISARILWAENQEMKNFEKAYHYWKEEMAMADIPNTEIVNNLIQELKNLEELQEPVLVQDPAQD